jgi:hypothetical protein
MPALRAQSPEYKLQSHQKEIKEGRKRERKGKGKRKRKKINLRQMVSSLDFQPISNSFQVWGKRKAF